MTPWYRFLHSILVFARSATHRRICQNMPKICQDRQVPSRNCQVPYRSMTVPTHFLTITRHNLLNESQPAKLQMRGRRCQRRMASPIIKIVNTPHPNLELLNPTQDTHLVRMCGVGIVLSGGQASAPLLPSRGRTRPACCRGGVKAKQHHGTLETETRF